MSKYKVNGSLNHDGKVYEDGSTFSTDDAELAKTLIEVGALVDPKAKAEVITDDADAVKEAQAKADKIVADAQAEADKVREDATKEADDIKAKATADAEKVKADAQAEADKVIAAAKEGAKPAADKK